MKGSIEGLTVGLLLLLCVSFCLTELSEVDLHWHLLTGETILRQGEVPRVDVFTYTSAGRPWIDLHWLFQVVGALVHRASGWAGLDFLKVGLIAGAFVLAAWNALRGRGAPATPTALVLLLAIVASQERFTLRPEAVSFLFLSALLLLLTERSRHPRLLVLIPPLLTLWANCHALYVVGVAVVLLTMAGAWIEPRLRGGAKGSAGGGAARPDYPAWLAAAALAATLLNPYGTRAWLLPWRLLTERIAADNVYARTIAEFQPPFGGFGPTASVAAFAVLVGVVVLVTIAAWREVSVSDALVLAALLCLALLARRNIPLFALAAVPFAGRSFATVLRRPVLRRATALSAWGPAAGALRILMPILVILLLADVWSNRFFERDGTQRYFGRGWAPGFYPEGAADLILDRRPPGEVLHGMTVGGYLEARFFPARRAFIDGRLEVHDESLFRASLALMHDPSVFEETARKFGVTTVLWSHRDSPGSAPLLRYLAGGHGWRPIFVDLAASVFAREAAGSGQAAVSLEDTRLPAAILEDIRRARAASARLDPLPAFLRRMLPRRVVPVAEVNAALFFGAVGSEANAETLLVEALRLAPRNAVIHYDLGVVLDRSGRIAEARREFDRAVALDGSFAAAREALALGRLREGDEEGALREWAAAERVASLSSPSLAARGALLAARNRVDEAIGDYRQGIALAPGDPGLRADLALLYQRRGLTAEAESEISRALALSGRGCAALVALARMRAAEGRLDEAEASLREALSAGPAACPEAGRVMAGLRPIPFP